METDGYGEEEYDYERDWIEHPWNIHEMEASFTEHHRNQETATANNHIPRHQGIPHNVPDGQREAQVHRDFQRQQQPPSQQAQPPQQQQHHQFGSQIQHQHRAVAGGPKLNFPEFNGDDCDG